MSLLRVTSPHTSGQGQVMTVMRDVLVATLPGVRLTGRLACPNWSPRGQGGIEAWPGVS